MGDRRRTLARPGRSEMPVVSAMRGRADRDRGGPGFLGILRRDEDGVLPAVAVARAITPVPADPRGEEVSARIGPWRREEPASPDTSVFVDDAEAYHRYSGTELGD